MVANPEITNVIATQSVGTVRCMIAIRNNLSTKGMVKTQTSEYSGGICTTNIYKELFHCISPSPYIYISGIQWLLIGAFTPATMPSALCVKTYQCTSGEDCSAVTCTSYSTSPYWTKSNIYIDYGLGVTPSVVTNTSVTPGDQNLIFKWTQPSNAPVTYNGVALYQGTTPLVSGYIIYSTSGGLSVSNLTNGVTYTLEVSAMSDDGRQGAAISISGTPIAPCTPPSCSFNIV